MNKSKFLSTLKEKLEILSPKEIEEILDEYKDHIDNKINEGLTEEEAVKNFGNIDDLAGEILSAYKLNESYGKKPKKQWLENIKKQLDHLKEQIPHYFNNLEINSILLLIVKLIFWGLISSIIALVLLLPRTLLVEIFRLIIGEIVGYGSFLIQITSFGLNCLYVIVCILLSIMVGIWLFNIPVKSKNTEKIKATKPEKTKTPKQPTNKKESVDNTESKFKAFTDPIIHILHRILVFAFYALGICALSPIAILFILWLVIWGVLLFLILSQVPVLGIFFTLNVAILLFTTLFLMLIKFLFKIKKGRYAILGTIALICSIGLGFGAMWSYTEIIQFEWVIEDTTTVKERKVKIEDIETISANMYIQVVEDQSLKDEIRILASYAEDIPDEKINIIVKEKDLNIERKDAQYPRSMNNHINYFRIKLIKQFEELKNKKLLISERSYNYVTIYAPADYIRTLETKIIYK